MNDCTLLLLNRNCKLKKLLLFSALFYCGIDAAAKQTITLHHGFAPGYLNDMLLTVLARFHEKYPEYKVEATSEGSYLQGFRIAYAAAKGKRSPADLYLVSEAGSPTLVAEQREKHMFLPVSELVPSLANLQFPAGLALPYGEKKELYALPFNPSLGIIYYNVTAFLACKLPNPKHHPLLTWEAVFEAGRKLHHCGYHGLTFPWTGAYTYEHLASIHSQHFATEQNGFLEMEKAKFDFSAPLFTDFFRAFFAAQEDGSFHYISDWAEDVEAFFAQQTCGMLFQGSGRKPIIEALLKKGKKTPIELAFGPLPYFAHHLAKGTRPAVPKVGGSALWVYRGTSNREGISALLRFLVEPTCQQAWVEKTGYLPITLSGYKLLKQSGFYQREPHAAAAIQQFLRPTFGSFTHVRLPFYGDIRGVLFNSLLQIYFARKDLSPEKKASQFLEAYTVQANERLRAISSKFKNE